MNNKETTTNINPIYQVKASDLRLIIAEMYHAEQERTRQAIEAQREKPSMTRRQAAEALNVTFATLWRWAKDGYLVPVKIGNKVLYRATDVEAILHKGV